MVLGFVGWPCAGKDVAAEYFRRRYSAMWWGHSNFIRARAAEMKIESPTTDQLSALFEARASHQGHGWIARIVCDRVRKFREAEPETLVVITGVRNLDEVAQYRTLSGFKLVELRADRELRFQRWCERARPSDGQPTLSQFDAIEQLDGNRNVPDVLALTDRVVENNGSLDDFYRALETLVKT